MRDQRCNNYLDWIRSLPCCICGGIDTEAAHLRAGSLEHGKTYGAMGKKPSDQWVLPLCGKHHREQHRMNEREFWLSYAVRDPWDLAMRFRRYFLNDRENS